MNPLKERRKKIRKTPFSARNIMVRDAIMVSYPRSGLCWMRWMLWEVRKRIEDVHGREELNLVVRHSHDGAGLITSLSRIDPNEIRKRSTHKWGSNAILLLLRDPRDVIHSNFKQIVLKHRRQKTWPTFSHFLRDKILGIEYACEWMNWWAVRGPYVSTRFMTLFYEDTRGCPRVALSKVLEFLRIDAPVSVIHDAVESSTIEKMRAHEDRNKNLFLDGLSGLEVGVPDARMVNDGLVGKWMDWDETDRVFAVRVMKRILCDALVKKWL